MTHHQLLAAAYVFERDRGVTPGAFELDTLKEQADISRRDPEEIAAWLKGEISGGSLSDPEMECTAFWALGKRSCADDRAFLREELKRRIDGEPSVIHQILIALENCGEGVFPEGREGAVSSREVALNLRDARDYLKKQI